MVGGQPMSKRFHETEIWNEDWFLDMDEVYRMFWFYIKDTCDHAGIWKPNVRRFNADVENKVDLSIALELFNAEKNRIVKLESGHWVLLDFVYFQYGKVLNLKNSCHLSVFNRLNKLEVSLGSLRGLIEVKEGSNRPQVEVKAGVKEQDKDKDILISNRLKAFKILVYKFNNKYPKELLDEFFNHFSELDRAKNPKMRWEKEMTWEIEKRLVKWASNDYSGIMQKKNGAVDEFKMDTVGRAAIGWCTKCGKSDFYEPKTIKHDDSKCCNVLLVPRKPTVEQNYQSQEIY